MDNPVEENVFLDWWAYESIDAEKGDDIVSHPEVWEQLELPIVLDELSTDDFVSLQSFSGELNLNAFAIGLGLENIRYEPEVFSGVVYDPADYDATGLIFWRDFFFTVGETADTTADLVDYTLNRLEMLGLDDEVQFESTQTNRVSEFL
jgi:hypothetical protein